MSGNSVKVGDGCATVTATIPNATAARREGGKRFEAQVRIPVGLRSSAPNVSGHFSAKRRMGPACAATAVQDSPNAFVLRFAGAKAFSFQSLVSPALVSQSNPLRAGNCFPAGKMKDHTERQMSFRFQSRVAPTGSRLRRRLAVGGAPGLLTRCIAKMSHHMLVNVP